MKPDHSSRHYSEIDFIRVIACLGVILYHFIHAEGYHFFRSFEFVNGSWAHLLVTVFFAVSGFVLYQRYGGTDHPDWIAFYRKRMRGMYPLFYISYAYVLLVSLISGQLKFTLRPLWTWLLSLLEMDGYFSARFETHYLIGEWFMGALIIVYILFPLLLKGIRKHPLILLALLVGADCVIDYFDLPTLSIIYSNVADCTLRVYAGMLIAKYSIQNQRIAFAISSVFLLICIIVEIPVLKPVLLNTAGCASFIILFNIGSLVCRYKGISTVISLIASLSYPVFLIHSATIEGVLLFVQPVSWLMFFAVYCVIVICCLVQSAVLSRISEKMTGIVLNRKN